MLAERPQITADMALAWQAWVELLGSRDSISGRLPLGAMVAWLDLNDIRDPETRQDTVWLLRVLEDELAALRPQQRKGGRP